MTLVGEARMATRCWSVPSVPPTSMPPPCVWIRRNAGSGLGWRSPPWRPSQRIGRPSSVSSRTRPRPPSMPTCDPMARRARAAALALLGRTLSHRQEWRPAIRATRAALALVESAEVRASLDQLIAEHGFRVTGHEVDSDASSPRDLHPVQRSLAPRPRQSGRFRPDRGSHRSAGRGGSATDLRRRGEAR